MRLILYFLILAFAFLPAHTQAQDYFLKKHKSKDAQPETAEELEKALGIEEPDTKPKKSNTTISNEIANQYFEDCKTQRTGVMDPNAQEMLCACTSAKMTETMSLEEMQAMFTDTAEGEVQRQRMMALIYIPCMEAPTKSLIHGNCIGNPDVTKSFKNAKGVCECLATNMSQFVAQRAPHYVGAHMRKPENRDVQALLSQFMTSKEFDEQSRYHTASCVKKHEFGW